MPELQILPQAISTSEAIAQVDTWHRELTAILHDVQHKWEALRNRPIEHYEDPILPPPSFLPNAIRRRDAILDEVFQTLDYLPGSPDLGYGFAEKIRKARCASARGGGMNAEVEMGNPESFFAITQAAIDGLRLIKGRLNTIDRLGPPPQREQEPEFAPRDEPACPSSDKCENEIPVTNWAHFIDKWLPKIWNHSVWGKVIIISAIAVLAAVVVLWGMITLFITVLTSGVF